MVPILHTVSALGASRGMAAGPAGMEPVIARTNASAGIDGAGDVTGEAFRDEIRRVNQGRRNAHDGLAFLQLASGVLEIVADLLLAAAELGRRASAAASAIDRTEADLEFQSIIKRIVDVGLGTTFNGLTVFNGSSTLVVVVAGHPTLEVRVDSIVESETQALGLTMGRTSLASQAGAAAALTLVIAASDRIDSSRSSLLTARRQLEFQVEILGVQVENLAAASTRLGDPKLAGEVVQLTKFQILSVSGAEPKQPQLQAILALLS